MCEKKYITYLNAQNAIKDVLFMYKTLIAMGYPYDDFGLEDGNFDPLVFIDFEDSENFDDEDIQLLHQGSAIKLICYILQARCQGDYPNIQNARVDRIYDVYNKGKFDHLSELKEAIHLALTEGDIDQATNDYIYNKYILGYFKNLIS